MSKFTLSTLPQELTPLVWETVIDGKPFRFQEFTRTMVMTYLGRLQDVITRALEKGAEESNPLEAALNGLQHEDEFFTWLLSLGAEKPEDVTPEFVADLPFSVRVDLMAGIEALCSFDPQVIRPLTWMGGLPS